MPDMPCVVADHRDSISTQASAVLPALMAILLGLFTVGVVGFSHIDVVHNAAHDVRHANAFPCH
jgi:cobalt transporter subunit CbtB